MKRMLSFFLAIMMLTTIAGMTAFAAEPAAGTWEEHTEPFSTTNGAGKTEENPILISTAGQLAQLAKAINSGNASTQYTNMYFRLENDLDLSAYRWIPIGSGPLHENFHSFGGRFNGNGKTITGLYVDETATGHVAGLFGHVANREYSVKNLTITNAVVKTSNILAEEDGTNACAAGILLGAAQGSRARIENCSVSGTVDAASQAGGLVGWVSYADFVKCRSDAVVNGQGKSGGFAGIASYSASFQDCVSTGTVNGGWSTGGFAGALSGDIQLENCLSSAQVFANDWNVGGFVGYVGTTEEGRPVITRCAAKGNVTSTVTGFQPKAGGFAGTLSESVLDTCYYTGAITASHPEVSPSGLVANDMGGTVTGCMYDSQKNPDLAAVSTVDGTLGTYDATGVPTDEILRKVSADVAISNLHKEIDVTGTYMPGAAAETVYQVDVSWGSLEYTYTAASQGTWNPGTHSYENQTPAAWSWADESNVITVTNHSNAAVDAILSYQNNEGFDVSGGFYDATKEGAAIPENRLSLESAAPAQGETEGQAKSKSAYFQVTGGSLTEGISRQTIGSVKVVISDAA